MNELRHLRRYDTDDCFHSLALSLVNSGLNYGNFVLVSLFSTLRLIWCISTTSLRPCHGRTTLHWLSTKVCWLQGRCHGVPRAAGSHAIWISWFMLLTCLAVADFDRHRRSSCCATIPVDNCWSSYISSRCITTVELIATWHPLISFSGCFSQCLNTFSINLFPI